MVVAMFAGMVVLGALIQGVLALANSSLTDASASLQALVMAFNMTAGMVAWMRYRGHAWRHGGEMAAAMSASTALPIALDWIGAIVPDAVLAVQHALMIPAMVGVMLRRREYYSQAAPRSR